MAQLGSACAWGARGRRFESCLPDQAKEYKIFINLELSLWSLFMIDSRLDYLPKFNAAGGVVLRKNKLLFINKKKGWEFPKGKSDEGESFSECAIRETSEETGLESELLQIVKFVGTTDYIRKYDCIEYHKVIYWYQMRYPSDIDIRFDPDTSEGIIECQWISIDDINKITIRDHMVEFVEDIYHNPSGKLEI